MELLKSGYRYIKNNCSNSSANRSHSLLHARAESSSDCASGTDSSGQQTCKIVVARHVNSVHLSHQLGCSRTSSVRSEVGGQGCAGNNVTKSKNPGNHPRCTWVINESKTSARCDHLTKVNIVKQNSPDVGKEKLEVVYSQPHSCNDEGDQQVN